MGSIIIPMGLDVANNQFRVPTPADSVKIPGIIGLTGTPAMTAQSAAGSGATVSITGSNISGKFILTTGISLLASGKILSMTFANSFTYPGGCVVNFSAGDSNFANVITKIYAATTTSGVDVYISGLNLILNTIYTGYYTVIGW